jgi:hypothetical protein
VRASRVLSRLLWEMQVPCHGPWGRPKRLIAAPEGGGVDGGEAIALRSSTAV